MEHKRSEIWGQRPGTLFQLKLRSRSLYSNFKKGLKCGNLTNAHVDYAKHTFLALGF